MTNDDHKAMLDRLQRELDEIKRLRKSMRRVTWLDRHGPIIAALVFVSLFIWAMANAGVML